MVEPIRELTRPLLTIPDNVLQALEMYSPQSEDQVIYRDAQFDHSILHISPDVLPNVGRIHFNIVLWHYFQRGKHDHDKITFRYHNEQGLIGEIQFLLMPDGTYHLNHRHVVENYRQQGVGERLLKQAEHTLQRLANRRKQPVEIFLQLGQRNVLQWFLKRGYEPSVGHEDMVEAVLHHPEQFIFDDITDKPGDDPIKRQDGIFLPGSTGRKIEDTVRINLEKTLTPQ